MLSKLLTIARDPASSFPLRQYLKAGGGYPLGGTRSGRVGTGTWACLEIDQLRSAIPVIAPRGRRYHGQECIWVSLQIQVSPRLGSSSSAVAAGVLAVHTSPLSTIHTKQSKERSGLSWFREHSYKSAQCYRISSIYQHHDLTEIVTSPRRNRAESTWTRRRFNRFPAAIDPQPHSAHGRARQRWRAV